MPYDDLETLLLMDGERYFIDPDGKYWVKFEVRRARVNEHIPHGVRYSLTLHGPGNRRILGYDNSHGIKPAGRKKYGAKRTTWDHRHLEQKTETYEFDSPEALISNFWEDVDKIMREVEKQWEKQ